jgi:hypothetical protein
LPTLRIDSSAGGGLCPKSTAAFVVNDMTKMVNSQGEGLLGGGGWGEIVLLYSLFIGGVSFVA